MPDRNSPDLDAGQAKKGAAPTKERKRQRRKAAEPAAKRRPPKQLPPYNVVLLDDDDHSYAYVVEMLQKVFGHTPERGYQLATEVDGSGRAIVCTTHKELAELKREQVQGYGRDVRVASCRGSMSAVIEPARA